MCINTKLAERRISIIFHIDADTEPAFWSYCQKKNFFDKFPEYKHILYEKIEVKK